MDTQKLIAFFLGVLVLFAIGAVFQLTQGVVLPLIIAMLLSFTLHPLVKLFMKIGIPRIIAITIVVLLIIGLFYLVSLFLYSSIKNFIQEYPRYEKKLQLLINDLTGGLLVRLDVSENWLTDLNWSAAIRPQIVTWSSGFMRFMGKVGITIIFLIFLLLENPYFRAKLKKAFPIHTARGVGIMLEHITRQIGRYLMVRLLISIATATITFVILISTGLDFPVIWTTVAFIFNFIPSIGSIFVVIVITLAAVVQFYPDLGTPIIIGILMATLQIGMGNFIEPKIQGDRLNLSPFIILASLLFWGWLWGVVGMLIAVPLMVAIKIICENISFLKPVSVLMGTGLTRRRGRRTKNK